MPVFFSHLGLASLDFPHPLIVSMALLPDPIHNLWIYRLFLLDFLQELKLSQLAQYLPLYILQA